MSALVIDLGKTTCRGVCESTRREGAGAPGVAAPGEVDELPATVTDARGCGRFAPSVARAAAGGDEVAADIVRRAGAALADTVRAALPRGGPLVVVGGLLNLGDLLWKPLRDNPTIEWHEPLGDAMDGARLLLDSTSTVHEPAVRRA